MNERQFCQVLTNRRRRGAAPLAERGRLGTLLRNAARSLRERQRAAEAWERCLPGAWAAPARVVAARSGVIMLEATDRVVAERLRRAHAEILKRLRGSYAAAREIRIVLAGEHQDADDGD